MDIVRSLSTVVHKYCRGDEARSIEFNLLAIIKNSVCGFSDKLKLSKGKAGRA